MTDLELTEVPVAKSEMLIRKPVVEVFEAFVNPEITTRFWFTKSTGRVEAGKRLTWRRGDVRYLSSGECKRGRSR
jgi:uncharacterized protein YndB with AHSA1/START domain